MAELGRLLKVFFWLRWRMLAGALAGQRRSGWMLLSSWFEAAGTALLWLSSLGGALGFGVAALVAGMALSQGGSGRAIALFGVRAGLGMALFGFLMAPAVRGFRTGEGARLRLRLLPIGNRTLHGLEVASGLADPWLMMVLPAPFVLGVVLAVGAAGPGWVVLMAAAGLVVCLAGLSAIWSFGLELLMRDRRRAEAFALVFGIAIVVVSLAPALFDRSREGRESRDERPEVARVEREERAPAGPDGESGVGPEGTPVGSAESGRQAADRALEEALAGLATPGLWTVAVPSESFTLCLSLATDGRTGAAAGVAGLLWAEALLLLALSYPVWRRLVTGVAESGGRRGAVAPVSIPEPPGVSPEVVAVAWAQVRTGLRTLPGRMAVVMPSVMVLFFGLVWASDWAPELGEGGPSPALAGAVLALAGVGMGLLSLQSLMLNQFAVDGSGLVLELQAPLTDRALVGGKALGCAVLAGAAVVPATAIAMALRPAALPLWPAALVLGASAFCLLAPVAAVLSALFPKAVDPSKFGRESNPHQLAGLIAVLATALALLPGVLVGAVALMTTGSAVVVTGVELLWAGISVLLCRYGLRLAAMVVAGRRENAYLALGNRG